MSKRFVLSKKVIVKDDNQPSVLGVDDDNEEKCENDDDIKKIDDIELEDDEIPKYFGASKLDSLLPNYYEKRKDIKNKKACKLWNKKINNLLKLYDVKSDKFNFELLLAIMQIVEDHMIFKKQCGKEKKQIVINIMLPFFENNLPLLSRCVEYCFKDLQKSSLRKRLLKRFFLLVFPA